MSEKAPERPPDEYARFKALARRLVVVPKREVPTEERPRKAKKKSRR